MKLLIITQAVDLDDPVLGFFHLWIAELAKRVEKISVVCLKEGRHSLPPNVSVYSLGKESGKSRIIYLARFYRYAWSLRREYDAVFVHMNQEYVLLGWGVWRVLGKRVVLWRNHRMGSIFTTVAGRLADIVCFTSPEAFFAKFKNAVMMPIGIDTGRFFLPDNPAAPGTILFLGRLDAVKKPDTFLEAMARLGKEGLSAHADVYGDPTPGREAYAKALKERFGALANASFYPGVTNEAAAVLYRSHAVYVNLTPSGSFDKTIGEAMASGCVVVAANAAVESALPPGLMVRNESVEDAARAMRSALLLTQDERTALARDARAYVEREHSLPLLVERLVGILA